MEQHLYTPYMPLGVDRNTLLFLFTNLLQLQVLLKMYREIIGDNFEWWFCLMNGITRH